MRKRNLRRITALVLCMVLVIGCGSVSAFAQPEETPGEVVVEEAASGGTSVNETDGEIENSTLQETNSESGSDTPQETNPGNEDGILKETDTGRDTVQETNAEGESQTETEPESRKDAADETKETFPESESEKEPEGVLVYVPAEQPLGIRVTAAAEAGVFPEGTVMHVTALDENSADYGAAKAALEAGGVAQDGFRAFDLSFFDGEGRKIEPENGSVQVRFELDKALLPEEAAMETLAVQHLEETAQGLYPETVAAAAQGTVAVDGSKMTADFSVDSFSVFAVTYGAQPYVNLAPARSTTQQLSLTKQWKTSSGMTVTNIPFGKVEVDVQQYYKVGTYPNLEEREIDRDTLVLMPNGWTDTYSTAVHDYSLFRALEERVYDTNGNLIAACVNNNGNWTVVYADGYDETDMAGWMVGSFEFRRDYSGASVALTEVPNKNSAEFNVPGGGLLVLKKGSEYVIWMPYLDYIPQEAREEIRAAVTGGAISGCTSARFIDEPPATTLAQTTIIYNEDGSVYMNFKGQSDWSWFAYGSFGFVSNVVSADLSNTLDTGFLTDLTVTKIWDDNDDQYHFRPEDVAIALMNGETKAQDIRLDVSDAVSGDANTWSKTVQVPKYNADGSERTYTISETVPENYTPAYDQANLTVTNRPSVVNLTVEKEVTGNMGDADKEFSFTLELSKNGVPYTETLACSKTGMADGTLASGDGVYTFTLKHGERIALEVPYGCTYQVTEAPTDYRVTIDDGTEETNVASGTANGDVSVKFVNDKTIHPPTGISRKRTPFVMRVVMAVTAAFSFVFVYLKRRDFE